MEDRSGIVLDLGSKGGQFETQWKHCVMSLSKALYPLLRTGPTQNTDVTVKLLTET